jgi:small-conductance mechanosensitive channel
MTNFSQDYLQSNIDYHVSSINTKVNDDLISRMQYFLHCVDDCLPDQPIPKLFIDYQNNIFPQDQILNLVAYFFDYGPKMFESGFFWVSNEIQRNEFLDINEETDIEKVLLKYSIKAEKSKIQELRKNFQKTDILTIMIASPFWYEKNFIDPGNFLIGKPLTEKPMTEEPMYSLFLCCPCFNNFCLCVLIYIIFGILAITGFVFACMGFKNEQAKKVQEFESMPLVCISFSISEFVVIVVLIILIIKGIKKWILIIIGIALLALCASFFYVYNDRFQTKFLSQNCGTNSGGACNQILSDGIKNYTISMMLASVIITFGYVFVIVLLILDCCGCKVCCGSRSIFDE